MYQKFHNNDKLKTCHSLQQNSSAKVWKCKIFLRCWMQRCIAYLFLRRNLLTQLLGRSDDDRSPSGDSHFRDCLSWRVKAAPKETYIQCCQMKKVEKLSHLFSLQAWLLWPAKFSSRNPCITRGSGHCMLCHFYLSPGYFLSSSLPHTILCQIWWPENLTYNIL